MNADLLKTAEAIERAACGGRDKPLEENVLAVTLADALAKGKDRSQLECVCRFLQLVQTALRSYL